MPRANPTIFTSNESLDYPKEKPPSRVERTGQQASLIPPSSQTDRFQPRPDSRRRLGIVGASMCRLDIRIPVCRVALYRPRRTGPVAGFPCSDGDADCGCARWDTSDGNSFLRDSIHVHKVREMRDPHVEAVCFPLVRLRTESPLIPRHLQAILK